MSYAPGQNSDGALAGVRVCCLIIADAPAYNARLIKVAESAASAGASVTIVYSARDGAEVLSGAFDTVRVPGIGVASTNRVWLLRVAANLWRELVAHPLRMARAAWRTHADIYHAHFLRTLLPAWIAARLRRAAVVYDARDLFVDAAQATWPTWRVRYFTRIEHTLAHRADAVLAVSEPMARLLEQRYRIDHVSVILNGASEYTALPAPASRPVKLLFQGAFRYNRNLASLVEALDALRGLATLTLQGWGDCEEALRTRVRELSLEDIVFFRERCTPRDVVACARDYDVGVICYRGETANLEVAVPNKLMDYIAAGLALAVSDLPGHRSIVTDESACGVLIDPSSAETIARGLRALVSDPGRVTEMKRASARIAPLYAWETQAAKLLALYRSLYAEKRACNRISKHGRGGTQCD